MKPPRPKKDPPDLPGGVEDRNGSEVVSLKNNSDSDFSAWSIPYETRDGLKIHIGQCGGIVLTQQPLCGDEAVVVLHPDEAKKLIKILPDAIRVAQRKASK